MTDFPGPKETRWIAHLLWLQAGMPEGSPRDFDNDAHGIAIGLFIAPLLRRPVVWSCDCGTRGELVGAADEAGRELLTIEANHTGPGHRLGLHNEGFL